jgi:DNA-binding CsgD family transcriptional regulator
VTVGAGAIAAAGTVGLFEREAELDAISALLDGARAGRGGLVLLESPAGHGKTALLEIALEEAEERGMLPLVGRGHSLEQEFVFGISRQLFEGVVASASGAERGRVFAGAAGLAAPLFETGASARGDAMPLVHGMQWLATNLAGDGGLLLAVDDAHRADAAYLRFLVYLNQRLAELPIALLVTARPDEGEAGELSALRGHPEARRFDLAPLGIEAVASVVRLALGEEDPAPEFCAACRETTGGNPFLLGRLLAELAAEGVEPSSPAADRVRGFAPDSVLRAVLARIAQLPQGADAVARAVAILDGDANAARVAALCELGPEATGAALDGLTAADLLAAEPPLRFAHPMIQAAIVADTPPRRRSDLHLRAAMLIDAEGAARGHAASHLLETAPGSGEGWIGEVLAAAAEEALLQGAPESAAQFLRRALEEPGAGGGGELRRRLGEARLAAGDPAAADDLAAAIEELEEPAERGEVALALGRAEYLRGRLREAVAAFDEGIAGLPDAGSELALRLQSERFQAATILPEESADAVARVAPMVEISLGGEPNAGKRLLLATAALGGVFAGRPCDRVLTLAERAYEDGRMLAEEGPGANALYSLTMVLLAAGEYERDIAILDDVLEAARAAGSVMTFATASFCQAGALCRSGRIVESIAAFDAAIDARRYGWEQFLPFAIGMRAEAVLEREGGQAAWAALEGLSDQEEWEADANMIAALRVRGRLRLLGGDAAAALEDFLAWSRVAPGSNPAVHAAWRSHAAQAYDRLGEREKAAGLAREELELARYFGAAPAIGLAQRALGTVLPGAEGIAALREAVATLAASEGRLELCRARVDLGAALRREGSRAEAREELREGLALAERLGAGALAKRAREELAMAGARPRRRALRGVASLTPGELRVVGLAAEGRSNREIAEGLFVTVKTVEWHLRNAFRKLDVTSRRQLAPALSERADA